MTPKPRARARRAQSIDRSRAGVVVSSALVDFVGGRGVFSSLLFSLAAPCLFPHSLFSNIHLLRSFAATPSKTDGVPRLEGSYFFSRFLPFSTFAPQHLSLHPHLISCFGSPVVLIHSRFVSNHSPILNWHTTPFITHSHPQPAVKDSSLSATMSILRFVLPALAAAGTAFGMSSLALPFCSSCQ